MPQVPGDQSLRFQKKHILSHPQICADQNLETVDLFRILYQLKGPVSHCFYVFNHLFDDFQDFASIHSIIGWKMVVAAAARTFSTESPLDRV